MIKNFKDVNEALLFIINSSKETELAVIEDLGDAEFEKEVEFSYGK